MVPSGESLSMEDIVERYEPGKNLTHFCQIGKWIRFTSAKRFSNHLSVSWGVERCGRLLNDKGGEETV